MSSNLILGILAAAGLLTLLLEVAAKIRDKLVDDGWLDDGNWLERARFRGFQRRIAPALSAVGITADHFAGLRGAASSQSAKRRAGDPHLRNRPDEALIAAIKPWIVSLDEGAEFRGNDRYVDTMGLVHHKDSETPSLAAIMDAWVDLLRRNEEIGGFDCVVTLKEGNSVLAIEFCNRVSPNHLIAPVLCKSKHDPSRVKRDSGSHETDFEGLGAFLKASGPPQPPRSHYRALAIDDNCTSGSSFYGAIREFNDFVASHQGSFPLDPIDHAVVLFVVNAGDPLDFAFRDKPVALHAMLALGSKEMGAIEAAKPKDAPALADQFKDHPACAFSTTLSKRADAAPS
jgi:hypothetical protein